METVNSYPKAQHCVRADRREETVDIYYLTELLFYFLTVPVCVRCRSVRRVPPSNGLIMGMVRGGAGV